MIVSLRNQVAFAPATRSAVARRIHAETTNNAAIESQVQRSGGRIYKRYHALNAFAAAVSPSERSTLQRNPAVAQVVPDTIVTLPQFSNGSLTSSPAGHTSPDGGG